MSTRAGSRADERSQRRLAVALVAPAVILMLAVTAYPIGYAIWLSLLTERRRMPIPRPSMSGTCSMMRALASSS